MARNLPPGFEENIAKRKKKKRLPFHGKAEGPTARRRADRMAMRRGGKVKGSLADAEPQNPSEPVAPIGGAEKQKFQFGGRVSHHTVRHVLHNDPLRSRTVTTRSTHRDRMAGEFKRGGRAKEESAEEERRESAEEERAEHRKAGGHITTAQRKALPSSEFALPGKGTGAGGKGPGSYPIDTENRARNALARGAQHASPGQLATIKRKVKAKYPDIEVGGE